MGGHEKGVPKSTQGKKHTQKDKRMIQGGALQPGKTATTKKRVNP
jgi:hypothetical protein